MKASILTAFLLAALQPLCAQDFPGFRAGNYTGVNGVFFNPASIADSRYRFDFNLVSLSTMVGNNRASFNLNNVIKSFDSDELEAQFVGSGAGLTSGMVGVDVHGPSLMFNTGKRASVALTTRARTIANIIDVDGPLASQLANDIDNSVTYPYTLSSNANMRLAVNGWSEFGVSYAQILKDEGAHFFKGGLTLKYLAGAGNGYLNMRNLAGTLSEDAVNGEYLSNTTGRIDVGFGGVNMSDIGEDFTKMESSGFGGDLGFVYEFRPDHEAYKSGDEGDWQRDRNKYKFKVGVALLDIGSMKYERDRTRSGGYDASITGAERLYLDDLSSRDIDDYKQFFESRPQYFTPVAGSNESNYKVALPTTIQLDVDYHLHRGFYAQLAAQLPMVNDKVYNSRYYSSFTFTPRYEGRAIGFYLPFNYNSLTRFNAGVSLRMGPLFIGSGSLITAVLGDSKQADVHFGIHIAGLHKNKSRKAKKDSAD